MQQKPTLKQSLHHHDGLYHVDRAGSWEHQEKANMRYSCTDHSKKLRKLRQKTPSIVMQNTQGNFLVMR